jgi:acyl-coenzyme A synthetase/AMP-(fatty) acid ligase
VRFIEGLPKTATGKIDRKPLRAADEGADPRQAVGQATGPETARERG